ncbi:response regulator transcription factor [Streptomyces sp. H39-S7]|uniref:response regulator transcription factor n=1 Tax=Streptomyces sp. H39-S7 TaxID=3004357 RepID=UPI0022AF246F|nr:response regulator transcription factor [Streptomyces sp. H39-S7]MCZ4123600.1 response regulator transcription factor [Streptomyces sp. H39-S7]
MASVLVVEDDPAIRAALIEILTGDGHVVRSAADGFSGLREVTQGPLDAVILDLGLPDLDGSDALRMIRGISQVPVLVVTARDDDAEIVRLLNAGADDYLVKPFSSGQLTARLTAVLRRVGRAVASVPGGLHEGPTATQGPMVVGELRVDAMARTAHLAGRELQLTRREFDLLAFLAGNAGRVVSKRKILTEVWRESYVDDATIDVHLSALRRKLGERAIRPKYLHTVRGVGIKLVTPP